MRLYADRSHARSTAAMRNAEGLVQIEMANVRPVVARPRQPDLRIQIGAIEVHLTAMVMHDIADRSGRTFEDAMRRGIGNHDCSEPVSKALSLGTDILKINVAADVAGDRDDI